MNTGNRRIRHCHSVIFLFGVHKLACGIIFNSDAKKFWSCDFTICCLSDLLSYCVRERVLDNIRDSHCGKFLYETYSRVNHAFARITSVWKKTTLVKCNRAPFEITIIFLCCLSPEGNISVIIDRLSFFAADSRLPCWKNSLMFFVSEWPNWKDRRKRVSFFEKLSAWNVLFAGARQVTIGCAG